MEETHSPMHGQICANVIELISRGLPNESRGILFSNQPPILIRELDEGHHLEIICRPDIAYIAKERVTPNRRGERHLPVPPDLAVEVFEPGDQWEAVIKWLTTAWTSAFASFGSCESPNGICGFTGSGAGH